PDAVAAMFEDTGLAKSQLTYIELNRKANQLAGYLIEMGVEPGDRVGIYLAPSLEMLIGVLGVLKSGGSYVPLATDHPEGRVKYILDDAGIEMVLLGQEQLSSAAIKGVDVLLLEGGATDETWLSGYGTANPEDVVEGSWAEQVPYILYTSGSTGRPKGVKVTHQGVVNYLSCAQESYLSEEHVGSVVSSPLSFDATLTTLLTPLCMGKSVTLLANNEGMLEALGRYLMGAQSYLFKITPAHLEALDYQLEDKVSSEAGHCVVVGGEQLLATTVVKWKQKRLSGAKFVNEYGPTETVVGCSQFVVDTEADVAELLCKEKVNVPIGRGIANSQLYVLGSHGQLLPVNSIGELHIGGVGVAQGYLGRDDLTAEKFISNPFGEGRLYKTGDLVRWLPEGNLEFLGRIDHQVKIRGYRIELGEIEHALSVHESVQEAVVLARQSAAGDRQLVAYVSVGEAYASLIESAAFIEQLRSHLKGKLPDYMLPGA
ncbi:non-ribosomal peptide synthetase, partial [Rheinheimera gaetbuli]